LRRQERKQPKYRAKPVVVDGITFPSRKQGRRYQELRLLEKAGQISDLRIDGKDTTFKLVVAGHLICTYRADAVYVENGRTICEDTKGFRTDVYRLKRKLMLAIFNYEIRET
jgi:hypothetical protein